MWKVAFRKSLFIPVFFLILSFQLELIKDKHEEKQILVIATRATMNIFIKHSNVLGCLKLIPLS